MSEDSTEKIPHAEMKKAEGMLTPEQKVASEARYEVLKHKDSIMKAGVSEEQVNASAENASEAAIAEHKELVAQNPWVAITEMANNAVEKLDGDERTLAETFMSWNEDLPSYWRDQVHFWSKAVKKTNPDATFNDVLQTMHNSNARIHTVRRGEEVTTVMKVAYPKNRDVIEDGLEWSDPGGRDVIRISQEGIKDILESFGAEVPEDLEESTFDDLVETKLPGVSISVYGVKKGRNEVALHLSPETLEKIVTLPGE